ncbi:MAG: outer membrane beta-barrel protein [Cytophagaceae bacterium]
MINIGWAQTFSGKAQPIDSIEIYAEGYYGLDLAHTSADMQPTGIYNHKRLNQPSLNMAMFRWRRTAERYRIQCSFMLGDYSKYNLSHEPLWVRSIYELNVGVKLFKNEDIWLDAGVMSSPVGFESAVGLENLTLTRSLTAENTPYYVNGIRLSQQKNRWMFALWLTNGWQTIAFTSATHPTGATQIQYSSASGKFQWSINTMWGNYDAINPNRFRTLINTYAFWNISKKTKIIGGLDVGTQQMASKDVIGKWWNPTLIAYYQATRKVALSVRGESYHDPQGVNFVGVDGKGMTLAGGSMMFQYQVTKFCWWRTELRYLHSTSSIFYDSSSQFNNQWHWSNALIVNWRGLE